MDFDRMAGMSSDGESLGCCGGIAFLILLVFVISECTENRRAKEKAKSKRMRILADEECKSNKDVKDCVYRFCEKGCKEDAACFNGCVKK